MGNPIAFSSCYFFLVDPGFYVLGNLSETFKESDHDAAGCGKYPIMCAVSLCAWKIYYAFALYSASDHWNPIFYR